MWISVNRIESRQVSWDELRRMRDNIQMHGMTRPIVVQRVPRWGRFWFLRPRTYRVVDGAARLAAAREMGWKSCQCAIVPGFPEGTPTPDECGVAVRRLLALGLSIEEISERTGRPVSELAGYI